MVLIVFRSRLRAGVSEVELGALGERMYRLATAMPGFVSYDEYASASGENVSIVQFESHDTLIAWRNHPEHVDAQRQARDKYFSEYRISVCDVARDYAFTAAEAVP